MDQILILLQSNLAVAPTTPAVESTVPVLTEAQQAPHDLVPTG